MHMQYGEERISVEMPQFNSTVRALLSAAKLKLPQYLIDGLVTWDGCEMDENDRCVCVLCIYVCMYAVYMCRCVLRVCLFGCDTDQSDRCVFLCCMYVCVRAVCCAYVHMCAVYMSFFWLRHHRK
jgi:hypothetical protein